MSAGPPGAILSAFTASRLPSVRIRPAQPASRASPDPKVGAGSHRRKQKIFRDLTSLPPGVEDGLGTVAFGARRWSQALGPVSSRPSRKSFTIDFGSPEEAPANHGYIAFAEESLGASAHAAGDDAGHPLSASQAGRRPGWWGGASRLDSPVTVLFAWSTSRATNLSPGVRNAGRACPGPRVSLFSSV